MVKLGITRLLQSRMLRGLRVGAILNPTSVDPEPQNGSRTTSPT